MKMKDILYHGSEKIIEHPKYGYGSPHNDYGRGFYCTMDNELAKEWACGNGNDGYSNIYTIDYNDLKVLDLNSDQYNILNWLAILTKYRTYWQRGGISEQAKTYLREHFMIDISGYDVIKGYRANDSYFSFAQDFVAGTISLRKLSEAMRLGELGEQIVLKSKKAFDRIKYQDYELANAETYFDRKKMRDRTARRAYRQTKTGEESLDDIYILDIMREGMGNDDSRLR